MERPTQEKIIYQYKSGFWKTSEVNVVAEQPVSLTVNGEVWLSLMCTPQDLQALAVGFLYNEQVIQSTAEIASLHVCADGHNVDVWLHRSVEEPPVWRRTSGCTGGFTSASGEIPRSTHPEKPVLTPATVRSLTDMFFESQSLYRKAGGIHTSALSDGATILALAEDIGRHNTFDKIAGMCLLNGIKTRDSILITTGRISSEMLQKAARMGVPVLISRTSPTTMSIELARRAGITLVGYARRDGFNVYSHPERISQRSEAEVPAVACTTQFLDL